VGEYNRRILASPLINISQSVNSLPHWYVPRAFCLQRLYVAATPFPHATSLAVQIAIAQTVWRI